MCGLSASGLCANDLESQRPLFKLADRIGQAIGKTPAAQKAVSSVAHVFMTSGVEGLEEAGETFIDPFLRSLTIEPDKVQEVFGSDENRSQFFSDVGQAFL